MDPQTPVRTLPDAVADVRYGYHYGDLNERFWLHVDTLLNVAGALGGSAGFASLISQSPLLASIAGGVMALASVLQLVLRPGAKAVDFRDARRAFADLDARAWGLTLEQVDAELKRLQAASAPGLSALEMPAFNASVRADGHDAAVRPLSWWQRLMTSMA